MTPEKVLEVALRRAVTWSEIRIATEHGLVTFRDLHPDVPIQGYVGGFAYDVVISVKRRAA